MSEQQASFEGWAPATKAIESSERAPLRLISLPPAMAAIAAGDEFVGTDPDGQEDE